MIFGRQNGTDTSDVSFWDNEILDTFEFPFGNWIEETVDWADVHLASLFDAIRLPFDWMLTVVVDWIFLGLPWWAIVALIGLLGLGTRGLKVGLLSAAGIAFCGLLGNDFWDPTAKTIGMISTAVIICAAVGVPLGILCGRVDSAWNLVRPVLDGMQVVHPFVYLLPVIFFFGIGTAPGVMVTMVFALPPIVRLTNLGIRQVPEDVVEAARSYGAPEWRVLTDVQLPLSREAILTGLNQTLLMAVSMVGIIALMAAGGLGQMVFRGVQNLNVPLAASSGLALYLVAVVMDRISQPVAAHGGMFTRLYHGWVNRRDPERLMTALAAEGVAVDPNDEAFAAAEPEEHGSAAPITAHERLGALVAIAGVVVALVAVNLPWSTNGAPISTYPRSDDATLTEGMTGFAATGGSWFGGFMVVGAVLTFFAMINIVLGRPNWPRSLGPEGAMAGAGVVLAMALAFVTLRPSGFVENYSLGSGAWLALAAGLLCFLGAAIRLYRSPYRPRRVPQYGVRWGQILAVVAGALLVLAGAFGSWIYDDRPDANRSPEIEAKIAEIREQATTPAEQAAAASEIASLLQPSDEARVTLGMADDGPRLGFSFLLLGAVAAVVGVTAALSVFSNRWKWFFNALAFGLGCGAALIPLAWTVSLLRVAPDRYYSGAGCLAAIVGTSIMAAAVSGRFGNYHRQLEWGVIDMGEVEGENELGDFEVDDSMSEAGLA